MTGVGNLFTIFDGVREARANIPTLNGYIARNPFATQNENHNCIAKLKVLVWRYEMS